MPSGTHKRILLRALPVVVVCGLAAAAVPAAVVVAVRWRPCEGWPPAALPRNLCFRATAELERARTWRPLAQTVTEQTRPVAYPTFLTWRGMLDREPPRRPDPEPPSPPASARHSAWKHGFVAGSCASCGTRHLPPSETCMACGSAAPMEPLPLASSLGTVVTHTVDKLTYSLSPPVVAVVIDVDGGGRFQTELTDCDPDSVAIGDRVEMTFRRFFLAGNGIANYFWKARPVTEGAT